MRANCTFVNEASGWAEIVYGDLPGGRDWSDEDRVFLDEALACLPEGLFDETSWKDWTSALKARTGRKGKALFMPLRLALTGLDHGPELAGLLPLIGRERTVARLGG